MNEPVVARRGPYMENLAPGDYLWCACGRSARQPFCDGSHEGTGIMPLPLRVTPRSGTLWLCGCKHARTRPHCDGSHNKLPKP